MVGGCSCGAALFPQNFDESLFSFFFTFHLTPPISLPTNAHFLGGQKKRPCRRRLPSVLPSSVVEFIPRSFDDVFLLSNNRRCALFHLFGLLLLLLLRRRRISPPPWRRAKSTEEATAHPHENDEKITNASCYCGKIKMEILGKPWRCPYVTARCAVDCLEERLAFSRCTRRTIFMCAATENDLWSIQSSPNVTRYRCKECGSPVYATLGKGKTYVVPRSALTNIAKDDESFKPTHHMHYKQRCIDIEDELPKFVGTSAPGRAEVWNPSLD